MNTNNSEQKIFEHKVYIINPELSKILGKKEISDYKILNWKSYDIETFSLNLIKAIDFLAKDNTTSILNIYYNIFNKTTDDYNYAKEKIIEKINKYKEEENKDYLLETYDIITKEVYIPKKLEEIDISHPLFDLLSDFSKKRVILYRLKNKFKKNPGEKNSEYKERLKEIICKVSIVYRENNFIFKQLKKLGEDPIIYKTWEVFWKWNINDLGELLQDLNSIPYNMQDIFLEILKEFNVSENIKKEVENLLDIMWEDNRNVTGQEEIKIPEENIEHLKELKEIKEKKISDFNPFTLSLDLEKGLHLFWEKKLEEIYKKVFLDISKQLIKENNWILPDYAKLLSLNTNKLKEKSTKNKETELILQYIIEFPLEENLTLNELKKLASLLEMEIGGINLKSPVINKKFKHPIITLDGNLLYDGFFSDWLGFEWNHILLIKGEKKNKLRLSLSYFTQDTFTYLISQIWVFLKNKKFKKRNQLYFDIYHNYNKKFFSNKIYDISIFKEKYENFFLKAILPFTKEGLELWIEGSNIILAWVYGTGKSNFLQYLLQNKEFKFKWKNFFLNANVIPIDLDSFKLLIKETSKIKTRLDEIYRNTKAPILIIIEDLDTLITEKVHWYNNDEIAQATTTLLQGIGSIPIYFITSSNNPVNFSERLLRPGRFEEIIVFNIPSFEEKKQILKNLLEEKNINLSKDILEIIYQSKIMIHWTSSHIWKIAKEIQNTIKTKQIFWEKEINKKDIYQILQKINIAIEDIQQTEKEIKEWYHHIKGEENNKKVWFIK